MVKGSNAIGQIIIGPKIDLNGMKTESEPESIETAMKNVVIAKIIATMLFME